MLQLVICPDPQNGETPPAMQARWQGCVVWRLDVFGEETLLLMGLGGTTTRGVKTYMYCPGLCLPAKSASAFFGKRTWAIESPRFSKTVVRQGRSVQAARISLSTA